MAQQPSSAAHRDPADASNEAVRQRLQQARARGRLPVLGAFIRLSGPGWMQSALSLGGGSLAASLYLGVLGGMEFLWLQPLAVLMGVIMLSAVAYVVLSTGENPFQLLRRHVSPVVAWSWLLGAGLACFVWAFPQFTLATAAVRENLLPGLLGERGPLAPGTSQLLICLALATLATAIVWGYDAGLKGITFFDSLLKFFIGILILAFFGVVVRLAFTMEGIAWGQVAAGFVPNFALLTSPVETLKPYLDAVDPVGRSFWTQRIAAEQRDLIITTAAVVVGVNSTVLLSYSMMKKGWDRDFRGLAIFDLSTGFFIPFALVTGCMLMAAATLFHGQPVEGLLDDQIEVDPAVIERFENLKRQRVEYEVQTANLELSDDEIHTRVNALPGSEQEIAAMLVRRDAFHLSSSLRPFAGELFSHHIFGIGVLGLALSTIIIQMVTWGFVTCEALNRPRHGWTYRFGAMPPVLGVLAPFLWTGQAQFWLIVPTSVFVAILLPIAYISFALLMNHPRALGEHRPRGLGRAAWNVLMGFAIVFATLGSLWSMWSRIGWGSILVVLGFLALIAAVNAWRRTEILDNDDHCSPPE